MAFPAFDLFLIGLSEPELSSLDELEELSLDSLISIYFFFDFLFLRFLRFSPESLDFFDFSLFEQTFSAIAFRASKVARSFRDFCKLSKALWAIGPGFLNSSRLLEPLLFLGGPLNCCQ